MRVIAEYRSVTPYYSTIINTTVDACAFLNGTMDNPLAKYFQAALTKTIPAGYIHPCPYYGYYRFENLSIDVPQVGLQFLSGNYKTTNVFYDNIDDLIFKSITKAKFLDVRMGNRKG